MSGSYSGITIDSEEESLQSASISNGSGTLCVRIWDTNGGFSDNSMDSVELDHVYVVTDNPSCP